ncbi:hypothetical protein HL653_02925 [Sphingomonas sp. AP4-R1]|uniref:hypothetical protein n=1 Tax=Sphingomonas sp. AP4-R1 TaxID=2735134 RepID=UPI001493D4E6|nr:hypothetical protein [Sphingomonas sp. AP4-R1]QJU56883.1 hypothetical protein HL653_02925 [Sphingomonas sp. AP4-R1]
MTAEALDALIEREAALVAALDAGDLGQIESLTHGMAGAIAAVASAGGWRERADLRDRVLQALRLSSEASGRINYLADDTRRRMERLHTLAGRTTSGAYGRSGRMA